MSAYGIIIWISFIPFTVSGFNFLVSEINGLMGYQSYYITFTVFGGLTAITIIGRILHWAEEIMAVGIIGSVIFLLFEAWAIL